MERTMRAWAVREPGPIAGHPLELVEKPVPSPGPGEVLVRVLTCGVCRTDLHVAEGDLAVHQEHVTPGHEIVGEVVGAGPGAGRFALGDRVGIPWLRSTCGACRWCRSGRENLCRTSRYTGWDHDGGYAEYTTVPEGFAYRIPDQFDDDATAAPLLCAGIIGYRALRRAQVPPGGRLGLYGFGGSAHLTAQVALAQGVEVHVLTRGEEARRFALELGATSAGDARDMPPVPLDSAIIFAPAGDIVPFALEALAPGGTLALAGIHVSDIPPLVYQEHVFHEKTLTSVESNTRRDGEEFLTLAARLGIRPENHRVPVRGGGPGPGVPRRGRRPRRRSAARRHTLTQRRQGPAGPRAPRLLGGIRTGIGSRSRPRVRTAVEIAEEGEAGGEAVVDATNNLTYIDVTVIGGGGGGGGGGKPVR